MTYRALPCFKAYDSPVRVEIDLDKAVVYRVGRAVAQHFAVETVFVGFDARETSLGFAAEDARGVTDAGADVAELDEMTLSHDDMCHNIRKLNTEPIVRLNVEGRRDPEKVCRRLQQIKNTYEE